MKTLKKYSLLCKEIELIISKKILNNDIKVANISSRSKTVDSFCEKISRKSYDNPLADMMDLAGVRVVYLYTEDKQKIKEIIENEFDIIESIDKSNDDDKFGYGALHYIVKLKKRHNGVRYDELKSLVCEIQVRTILQDAWAVVAHELSYKNESDIPKQFRRRLNALSGLFEIADAQFELIRKARNSYQDQISESIKQNKEMTLNEKIELDNLEAYLGWKFPERDNSSKSSYAELLEQLKQANYTSLANVDNDIDRAMKAFLEYEKQYPPYNEIDDDAGTYNKIGAVRIALQFINDNFLNMHNDQIIIADRMEKIEKYKHLIDT